MKRTLLVWEWYQSTWSRLRRTSQSSTRFARAVIHSQSAWGVREMFKLVMVPIPIRTNGFAPNQPTDQVMKRTFPRFEMTEIYISYEICKLWRE